MKVENMTSARTGREVANQFIIYTERKVYFQSYKTVIACREASKLTLVRGALDFSRTTSKYLYQFTGLNREEILQGLKDGTIKETGHF